MDWFFGGSKFNKLPTSTPLQSQRLRQIESLKLYNQNVLEIQRDVEYRILFTAGNLSLSLNITLPPQFPQERPIVKVSPPVQHRWVNQHSVVIGCNGINNFMMHSDLGKIIKELVTEFQMTPPVLNQQALSNQHLPYPLHPTAAGTSSLTSEAISPYHVKNKELRTSMPNNILSTGSGHLMSLPMYQMPPLPVTFPELNKLSYSELQDLHSDEDKLIQHLLSTPVLQQLSEDREKLSSKNEEIAKSNLRKRPVIEEHKKSLIEKIGVLTDLRKEFDASSQKQHELARQYDTSSLRYRLQIAAQEAEEESESFAEQLLEKKIPLETFLQSFLEKRSLCHMRKVKEEKLFQNDMVKPRQPRYGP